MVRSVAHTLDAGDSRALFHGVSGTVAYTYTVPDCDSDADPHAHSHGDTNLDTYT